MKKLWIALGLPLAVGGLATLASGGMRDYGNMAKPPLSPPGWVFPVVWTLLYLAMGYASYRVATKGKNPETRKRGLRFYIVQLFLNFLWPIVFFRLENYLGAFVILLLLWVFAALTMWQFYKSDEIAGDLLIPYLLWLTFAAYLNFGVYLLNG